MGTLARNGLITYLFVLITYLLLNPIQDGHFRGCSRIGGGAKRPKICHTYPAVMKLGTVISYLKKIQKI